ncbi:MAG TPA: hypothetical protein DCP90_02695 [Clostridiales bacterium]|nr:MAG: hypothetical protein A2Y22_01555 [Clostridiales bacterium GWD2_32_59]HAN09501.1 hypothetical protein [Clostridiales bacterium]
MGQSIRHYDNTQEASKEINVNCECIKKGETLGPKKGVVVVDTGNKLNVAEGLCDHHQLCGEDAIKYSCAASIIQEKFEELKNYIDGFEEITVQGHENPDPDCIASIYMVQYIAKYGKLPPNCESMVDYVGKVDQAKIKYDINNLDSVSLIMSVFSKTLNFKKGEDKNLKILENGFKLIEYVSERIYKIEKFTGEKISWEDPRIFEVDHPYKTQVEFIKDDLRKYIALVEKYTEADVKALRLPLSSDITKLSKKEFNILDLGKLNGKKPMFLNMWASMHGYDGIMYNSAVNERGNNRITQHISSICINPDSADYDGKEVCLGHIGKVFEARDVAGRMYHKSKGGNLNGNEGLIPNSDNDTGVNRHGNDGSATGYKFVIPGDAVPYDVVVELLNSYLKNPYNIGKNETEGLINNFYGVLSGEECLETSDKEKMQEDVDATYQIPTDIACDYHGIGYVC